MAPPPFHKKWKVTTQTQKTRLAQAQRLRLRLMGSCTFQDEKNMLPRTGIIAHISLLQKIAQYFDVPIEDFLIAEESAGGKEESAPAAG